MVHLKKNTTNLIVALLMCFNAYAIEPQGIDVLHNITHKSLPLAHAELIHLQKEVAQGLAELNITDPVEQKECLIQQFGVDVRKEAHTAYKERQDHKEIAEGFNAIKVEDALITILDEHTNYAETTDKMAAIAESVLENAQLCQLPFAKDVEQHIFSSLHVMRNTDNPVEYIYNATAVDIMLTDLQNHSEAILEGKPVSLERCTELTSRAVGKFIEGLNPITQAQNMGHGLVMAAKVVTYPIIHPVDTTEKVSHAADRVADYLISNAYFTTSLTVGKLYLSPLEYQARLDRYLQSIDDLPSNPVANLTAENWIDLIAQVAADFVFGKGFVGVIAYLKEIDAMSKISKQAHKVGEILIHGVDTHLKDNPVFVTAEGIAIEITEGMKNVKATAKEIITDSCKLIEAMSAGTIDTAVFNNLKSIGNNIWQSPRGLIYGYDKKFGNTLNHTLAHMTPNPLKKTHTVFSIPKNKIVQLIDDAWMLKGEHLPSDPRAYIIDMKKCIGTNGETAIKIVVKKPGTCEILTAYPITYKGIT